MIRTIPGILDFGGGNDFRDLHFRFFNSGNIMSPKVIYLFVVLWRALRRDLLGRSEAPGMRGLRTCGFRGAQVVVWIARVLAEISGTGSD